MVYGLPRPMVFGKRERSKVRHRPQIESALFDAKADKLGVGIGSADGTTARKLKCAA